MTLADDLKTTPDRRLGKRRCVFGQALDAFPDEADEIVEKCRTGKKVTDRRAQILIILANHGHEMGESAIDRHLRTTCVCYR